MVQRLFVYGTLAPGKSNENLLRDIGGSWQIVKIKAKYHEKGWGLTMGYPAIILDESADDIIGYLFSSNNLSKHWDMLDDFEGECYERILTQVELNDNSIVDAYVYTISSDKQLDIFLE